MARQVQIRRVSSIVSFPRHLKSRHRLLVCSQHCCINHSSHKKETSSNPKALISLICFSKSSPTVSNPFSNHGARVRIQNLRICGPRKHGISDGFQPRNIRAAERPPSSQDLESNEKQDRVPGSRSTLRNRFLIRRSRRSVRHRTHLPRQ